MTALISARKKDSQAYEEATVLKKDSFFVCLCVQKNYYVR